VAKRKDFKDWGGLTQLIQASLSGRPGFAKLPTVGRLSAIQDGIGHDNYCFLASGKPLLIRLPKEIDPIRTPEVAVELLTREAETLRRLESCKFPYSAPRLVCSVADKDGQTIGLIESCLPGVPLSQFKTGVHGRTRTEVVAEVAASVHALPVSEFSHLAPCENSESHIRAELDMLSPSIYESPVAAAARDWIVAHVTHRPAVVLHGDLLPQNLVWDMMGEGDLSVVDWEYARLGDPAYDLAIVTRGERQPLKESGGFQRLLSAYETAAGTAIPASAVRTHEMLMILGWLADAAQDRAEGRMEGQGPDYYLNQLTAVLRRSTSAE
jgi:aminoglycoside phosphotransferase (APT) family kinase protein